MKKISTATPAFRNYHPDQSAAINVKARPAPAKRQWYCTFNKLQYSINITFICIGKPKNFTGTCHHGWLTFVLEVGFHHIGQTGLELLTSSDLPTLASQSAAVRGVNHCTQLCSEFVVLLGGNPEFQRQESVRSQHKGIQLYDTPYEPEGQSVDSNSESTVSPRLRESKLPQDDDRPADEYDQPWEWNRVTIPALA
ncbi:SH2 domain-containing adapter protein B, partial [Plecturocebus cupreus]